MRVSEFHAGFLADWAIIRGLYLEHLTRAARWTQPNPRDRFQAFLEQPQFLHCHVQIRRSKWHGDRHWFFGFARRHTTLERLLKGFGGLWALIDPNLERPQNRLLERK